MVNTVEEIKKKEECEIKERLKKRDCWLGMRHYETKTSYKDVELTTLLAPVPKVNCREI